MPSFQHSSTDAGRYNADMSDAPPSPVSSQISSLHEHWPPAVESAVQFMQGDRARLAAIPASGHRRPVCHSQQGLRRQRGQAMTEYLVIVALVAVAAIAVYQSFGQVIRAQVAGLARELSGESATQAVDAARTASGDAIKQKRLKSLKSYGNQEQ